MTYPSPPQSGAMQLGVFIFFNLSRFALYRLGVDYLVNSHKPMRVCVLIGLVGTHGLHYFINVITIFTVLKKHIWDLAVPTPSRYGARFTTEELGDLTHSPQS